MDESLSRLIDGMGFPPGEKSRTLRDKYFNLVVTAYREVVTIVEPRQGSKPELGAVIREKTFAQGDGAPGVLEVIQPDVIGFGKVRNR